MFKHHSREPGQYRGWLHLNLPENPVCWLLGHRPKPVITEWKTLPPSLWIECARCARRYNDPTASKYVEMEVARGRSHREVAEELTARRVANARRDPVAFVSDVHRRAGWSAAELVLHHEVHWPGGKRAKRLEAHAGKWWTRDLFSFRFHLGNRGSETPFDGHAHVGRWAYYWSVGGVGGRLAEWLGRGHKRDLRLAVHGGSVWWKVWHDDDGGSDDGAHRCDSWRQPRLWPWSAGRRKHRGWMCLRDGNLDLNPADALWGSAKYSYEPLEEVTTGVQVGEFPGDSYLVKFTLERQTRRREHGPRWARRVLSDRFSVDFDTRGLCNGIPVRNHSWKGDETLAGGVRVPALEGFDPAKGHADLEWVDAAVDALVEDVKRDRRRYRYQAPVTP